MSASDGCTLACTPNGRGPPPCLTPHRPRPHSNPSDVTQCHDSKDADSADSGRYFRSAPFRFHCRPVAMFGQMCDLNNTCVIEVKTKMEVISKEVKCLSAIR